MARHAAQAVPWRLVGAGSTLIVVLLAAVRWDQWRLWPLQGVAVGLLGASAGWCLDEPAAAMVDPAPRGLGWRTAARAAGITVLLASWSAGVWWARSQLHDHPWPVFGQGLSAVAVALAWVTWRRARGEATPGQRWAAAVVPVVTAWALVRPLSRQLPVFPYVPERTYGSWGVSSAGWTATGLLAVVFLSLVLTREGKPWERMALPFRRCQS